MSTNLKKFKATLINIETGESEELKFQYGGIEDGETSHVKHILNHLYSEKYEIKDVEEIPYVVNIAINPICPN